MTAVVIMLVLVAAMTVTWVALVLAERDMKAIIGDQQYALLSSSAAQVDAHLTAKKVLLASLAESLPPDAGASAADMRAFVAAHPRVRSEFSNLVIFNQQGDLLHTQGDGAATLDLSPRLRAYLRQVLAAGQSIVSPPYKSLLTGEPAVIILQPVQDASGQGVLLLGGSLDLAKSTIMDHVAAQKSGRTGYTYIMTTKGIMVQHPDHKVLLDDVTKRPVINLGTQKALAGFEGWTEAIGHDGRPGIYSYKRLQSTDWIIGARYPLEEAFAPMIAMRRQGMLAAAVFAAIAGLMAWLAIRVMLRPLNLLQRHIGDIRNGSADIGVLQRGRRDEIGELSGAFHELMAEREAAQTAIRDSEALVSSILERAPDAFVSCSVDGAITNWNAAAERTFGWRRAEALGRDIAELIVPPAQRAAHGAGMRAFGAGHAGRLLNARMRITALHRDGHEVPIELSLASVRHGGEYYATAFLHDITERVLYEQQIAASEKRLRMVADSIPAMIAYLDRDLRYRFTNEHIRTLMGVDPQAMLGKTVAEVFGPAMGDALAPHLAAASTGHAVHYEREHTESGAPRQVMTDITPDIGADGQVAGYYLMTLDITERKNAELRQAASEKRLKLLTDHLPVLIAYFDRERRFQFANATFERWFGIPPATLIGRALTDGIADRHYHVALPYLDRAYQGEVSTYEQKTEISGAERTLETTFVPELGADGTVVGIYALTHDTTRLKDIEERLTQLARIDPLTGIANRLMFEEILQVAVVRARRQRTPLALAYLDIDHFKAINDSLGHGAGDTVLHEFAARLCANVRAVDTVARIAGDEFVIIFEQVTQADEAARLADKIVAAIRVPFTVAGAPLAVTTSIGIALHDGDELTPAELVARADAALYQAKRQGRDGYALSS
jgi:diguanylate cyclase (GGDEF)-like protein/PAS domain S-box-containing protein